MALSQNASFYFELNSEHPPGKPIVQLLQNNLVLRGWRTTSIDNWRDCGWVADFSRNSATIQMIVAKMASASHWMLQIGPNYFPGIIGKILGKKASASSDDVYAFAVSVHDVITSQEQIARIVWCWDDVPNESNGTTSPEMAE